MGGSHNNVCVAAFIFCPIQINLRERFLNVISAKKLSNPFSTCPRRQDKVSQGDWIYAADAGWRQSGNVRLLDNSIPPPPLCGFSKAWKTSPWHICIANCNITYRIYARTYISVALWHLITCGLLQNCEKYASKIIFINRYVLLLWSSDGSFDFNILVLL